MKSYLIVKQRIVLKMGIYSDSVFTILISQHNFELNDNLNYGKIQMTIFEIN